MPPDVCVKLSHFRFDARFLPRRGKWQIEAIRVHGVRHGVDNRPIPEWAVRSGQCFRVLFHHLNVRIEEPKYALYGWIELRIAGKSRKHNERFKWIRRNGREGRIPAVNHIPTDRAGESEPPTAAAEAATTV